MNDTHGYGINDAKVVSETIEGEAIIINLETGTYYSMNESGSIVWDAIRSGTSFASIIDKLAGLYDASKEDITASVRTLIESALSEGIIFEKAEGISVSSEAGTQEKKPFVIPCIQRYDDMQDMLLADPIHDVDDAGWPTLKQKQA